MTHILLIEDNKDIREMTADLLEMEGYKVSTAKNGIEGISIANENKLDLILCDIMMPELDGYETLKVLNKNPYTNNIPFIFLTAKSEKNDFRKGMNLGADDYISKPFELDDIIKAIETRLQKNKLLKTTSQKNISDFQELVVNTSKFLNFEELSLKYETITLKNKEHAFKQGQKVSHIYFVQSGYIKVYRISSEGKEFVSDIFGKGEIFGHLSLFSKDKLYINSAMAMENAKITPIDKEDFIELMRQDRNASDEFIKLISKNMITQEEQIFDMAFTPVRKRAAKTLLMLFKKGVIDNQNEKGINIPREDFAGMIGTATETAIRTIKDFKNLDIIGVNDDRRLVLNDEEKLREIAQGSI